MTVTNRPETLKDAPRPEFDHKNAWKYTQEPSTTWSLGSGASDDLWKDHKKVEIDPYGENRPTVSNYKLLVSAIVPRPIGFISSQSSDGKVNLAPFSFFNVVNADPPIFAIGIASSPANAKDTLRNVLETGELTINVVSEWFVEAMNLAAVNAPADVDEFKLSGLTPLASTKVKPPHVAESAFSVEAKLAHHHVWTSRAVEGKITGTLLIVEGVNFHVREDVINEDGSVVDIAKLKPVARLGGSLYARVADGYDLIRPDFERDVLLKEEGRQLVEGEAKTDV